MEQYFQLIENNGRRGIMPCAPTFVREKDPQTGKDTVKMVIHSDAVLFDPEHSINFYTWNEAREVVFDEAAYNKQVLRDRRQVECFQYYNRRFMKSIENDAMKMAELEVWYTAWLNVTDTFIVPVKPAWLV